MKIRFYLIAISALLGLAACEKTSQTVSEVKHFAGNLIGVSAPKASDIVLQLPTVSPEELNLTAQTYQRSQNQVEQVIYFDEDGKILDAPTAGGFYREVLGKTADGRVMVQDFYHDTKLPQTTVLTIKNGGDVRNFGTSVLDGRNIWFNKEGGLHSVADYANGSIQGAQAFYFQNKLVGAVMAQKMLVFHNDGKILAVVEADSDAPAVVKTTLFRQDGSALVQSRMEGEKVLSATAWKADGSQIRKQAELDVAKQESLPLSKRADDVLRLMHE